MFNQLNHHKTVAHIEDLHRQAAATRLARTCRPRRTSRRARRAALGRLRPLRIGMRAHVTGAES